MTFLQRCCPPTRSFTPFRTNDITMCCRMLGSVFDIGSLYTGPSPHSSMCILLQVPPAPAHGQPEGHREDVPPPVGGVAGPGRMQDPHYIDMAYQGIVDYRPQPLAVSIFHFTVAEPLIINVIRAIEPCVYIPRWRTRPRYPGTSAT
jgi:hypothetical protein